MSRPRKIRARDYTPRFTDHADRSALMVFRGNELSSLPPLFGFLFYFTYPDTSISDIEPTATAFLSTFGSSRCEFRIDLHFLPGADDEQCIAHYKAELGARGTIQAQLDTLDTPDGELSHDSGGLPGLVPSYHFPGRFYRNLIFIIPTRHWQNEDQRLRLVRFGAMDEQEYRTYMEENEEEVDGPLPPVAIQEVWLRNEDADKPSAIALRLWDMSNAVADACVDSEEAEQAWMRARNKPWQTWPVRKV